MRLWIVPFVALLFPATLHAAEPSFTDLPPTREEFTAVEDLKQRGIIEGRPDGTFGPDDPVNRAEAITIVVRAVANVKNLPLLKDCFPDVQGDAWFVQPVCYAKDLDWVGGYPDGTFQPVRTVSRVELLKILLNAYGTDVEPISLIGESLSPDAAGTEAWFYPYLAYAIASSMTSADPAGYLNPGVELTRGQVALLLHRFLLYREGQRDQALLTNAEKDIRLVFQHLDAQDIDQAMFALGRIKLAAWGLKQRVPESTVVQVTNKLQEALRELVEAYRFALAGDASGALTSSSAAYNLSIEADDLNQSATEYTNRVRSYAHDLAESVRASTTSE